MKRMWQQILSAVLMGAMLPGLVARMGELFLYDRPEQDSSEEVYEEQFSVAVPVLLTDSGVTILKLEEYLCGVVLGEMPVYFSLEALKAQAVAARTFTMRSMERSPKHSGGAVCIDPGCCQAYMAAKDYLAAGGSEDALKKVRKAVYETAGQVLTYNGELIEATYFACSGGRTEDAVSVWGSDVAYLQSVPSPGEEDAQSFQQKRYFSSGELMTLLGRTLTGAPQTWLGKVERTRGGGVATMVLAGKTYTGTQLRSLLGLNSTAFALEADDGGITAYVTGHGHRVGMSQYGAEAMAQTGSTYEEILTHYYQGTRIDKRGTVE